MVDTIYTIGYSGYKIENFLIEIKEHRISSVIDVRSNPYSQYYTDYNKENFEIFLKKNGVYYRNYVNEFGAQQKNRNFYSSDGYLDFEKFVKSEYFLNGVRNLKAGMDKGYKFLLMCAEKDPFNCHRAMMVASEFYKLGYSVVHLLPNGKEQSQDDIEMRLLEYYFPNRNQLDLFENENLSNQNLIIKAYRKRNAEIGYSMEEEI
jgi:uncharacterized protein (DUF488 family)